MKGVEPSINDVARAAGVSTATVSRALRGLPNVSAATAAKVKQVAEQLGYSASPAAVSLASGATRNIVIVCSQLNMWFTSNVCEAIVRAAQDEGFTASLLCLGKGSLHEAGAGQRRRVEAAKLRRRADAVIVVALPLLAGELAELQALNVPVVFVGPAVTGQACVHIDEYDTARKATSYLLGRGHQTIAHLTGPADDDAEEGPPLLRLRGYVDALAAAGIEVDYELIAHCDYDREAARSAARDLLRTRPDTSAILGFSDVHAAGALAAAADLDLRVPADIAIMGIDGSELSEVLALTSLAQDPVLQGEAAVSLALDMLTGAPVPEQNVFPTTLIERESV